MPHLFLNINCVKRKQLENKKEDYDSLKTGPGVVKFTSNPGVSIHTYVNILPNFEKSSRIIQINDVVLWKRLSLFW